MTNRATALSLGAGIQSTTALLLSLAGELPPFDTIVFADTGDEPAAVYTHLERLQTIAPITIVTAGRLSDTVTATFMPIPLYQHGGMGRRQCTYQYKLRPIRRHLRTLGGPVDLSVCISTDEILRAKPSGLQWCRNVFPLLEFGWSRADCETYLTEHWPHPVPRSACVYCPFMSDRERVDMREHRPADWAAAVAFDEAARPFGYVHPIRTPVSNRHPPTRRRWTTHPRVRRDVWSMTLARNRRLRVSVEVDILASATYDHAARALAAPAVKALSELNPGAYRVVGVSVSDTSDGSFIAGWEGAHPHRRTRDPDEENGDACIRCGATGTPRADCHQCHNVLCQQCHRVLYAVTTEGV